MNMRILAGAIVFTWTAGLAGEALAICGDVSGDRKVTTADALAVLRLAVGQQPNVECDECGSTCFGDPRFLLGEWAFQSDFDGTIFEDNYDLFAVDETECLIVGEDLDDGGIVIAYEASDSNYDYALVDPSEDFCDFFLFDRTGPNEVDGIDILLEVDGGVCGDPISGIEHPMIGDRVSSASATAGPGIAASQDPAQRLSSDALAAERLAAPVAVKPEILALLERMRAAARKTN